MAENNDGNSTTPPTPNPNQNNNSDQQTTTLPPANEIWFGSHRVLLDSPITLPARPLNITNVLRNAAHNDPIIISSDDDSAPPSQRDEASNNDPWAGATHFIIPPGVRSIDLTLIDNAVSRATSRPDAESSSAAAARAARPATQAFSLDADAARGILLGTPIARPVAETSAAAAARLHGPDLDVHVPLGLVQDTSTFAFAVIETPILGPFEFIRTAVEMRFPNVSFTFAASTYGSALMVFSTPAAREELVNNSPIRFAGFHIDFVRPEDTEDRSTTTYSLLVELAASNFPLELWHEAGAAFVFGHVGQLCCVDNACLTGSDHSSMRGFVNIEPSATIPPALIIRLPNNDIITVRLRIIQTWVVGLGAPFQPHNDGTDPPPPSPTAPRHPPFGVTHRGTQTMDDIDEESVHDTDQIVPDASPPTINAAATLASIHDQAELAHNAAAAAASAVVADAQDLIASIRDITASSFEFGSSSSHPPHGCAPPSPLLHENEARKRRVRAKRASDNAMKLRRSHRLAAKEEDNYIDMVSKAIKAKAASFDLSSATESLARALNASGLSERPAVPCEDVPALVAVALACGADADEAAAIADNTAGDAAQPEAEEDAKADGKDDEVPPSSP
jgi:hypothetical protein